MLKGNETLKTISQTVVTKNYDSYMTMKKHLHYVKL